MAFKKTEIDKILSENERLALQQFIGSEVMCEAVKKVLLFGIYYNGTLLPDQPAQPLLNFSLAFVSNAEELHLDNEAIGSKLRSAWEGIKFVEMAFSNIAQYKLEEPKTVDTTNQAR